MAFMTLNPNYWGGPISPSPEPAFPSGMIALWSGALADIPEGWALCDGTLSTPDLRDRFVVGAGDIYEVAATGGEAAHVLTVAELAQHRHDYAMSASKAIMQLGEEFTNHYGFGTRTGYTGNDAPHENRPPYYALCYVMKT